MSPSLHFLVVSVSALVLTILSTVESAYEQTSEVTLHMLRGEERVDSRAAFVKELDDNAEKFRMSVLLGIQVTVIAIALSAYQLAIAYALPEPVLAAFGAALLVIFVCRLFVPRIISQTNPQRILLASMPVFKPYYRIVSLVVAPPAALLAAFRRDERGAQEVESDEDLDTTMSDIQAFIDLGAEEGIIEEAEGLMIQSIVEFGDRVVGEVMTPRAQMVAVDINSTILQARDAMVESKYSRLPVFSGEIDHIEGVLYVRDLVAAWRDGLENEPVTAVMRPAYFVPEVKPVADLLEEMRGSKVQIALVIDEYGSVAGLVTIEDLLEEIVGEIEDEDVDLEDGDLVEEGDGVVLVKGSTEIRKVELRFGAELDSDDFTTVAGLMIGELGHLPVPGERVEFHGFEFEVLEADNRRINLIRLRRIPEPSESAEREATQSG